MTIHLDRTHRMGLFPHDAHRILDIEQRSPPDLAEVARDPGQSRLRRDRALWNLIYHRQPNIDGLLSSLAKADPDPEIRRSASWGLLKRGNAVALGESLAPDDDANVRAWKLHLIHESRGSTEAFDARPLRSIAASPEEASTEPEATQESSLFDVTIPLGVEGVVQFKDASGTWRLMTISQSERVALVGAMTAAVRAATFMTELVIQKRIENLRGSGTDYIDGYLFSGLSRFSGINTITHYYESTWRHQFYTAGRTGDDSKDVIDVETRLMRIAETDLARRNDLSFPYPQSVRGVFHGPIYMNPIVIADPDVPLDGLMQIVSAQPQGGQILANGWFFGSFRGIPEDVDGDGQIELNGVEMLVDNRGNVRIQRPATRSGSP